MIAEISLSVSRDLRRMPLINHSSRNDKGAERVREMVIGQGRFGRRCYFCDFAFGMTDGYEIHNLDGDHTNNDPENLVPCCELCHAPFHLDLVTRKWPNAPGKIIFLPEMSQPELNNLLQAIFYSMAIQVSSGKDDDADRPIANPHTVYQRLLDRAKQVEQNSLGEVVRPGLSNPFALSRVLIDMDDETYANRDVLLAGCRYLPAADNFVDQAGKWNANGAAFSRLDTGAWRGVAGMAE
ncbi:HNH endonuclease signature motif containing protein [Chromobacterium haemolyticum]|uniref:HNH endonuclease signature motif containing protein n=1 Tax=Chromobacterium haemolyticum TaxID=394935 RepID=UPI0024490626|nr:HNH endonuclease signature motif containing protein [Chromobacterium haemolyticum]MDH0342008.1 HNH endonuclease [Chromobacterium haemolyticum]